VEVTSRVTNKSKPKEVAPPEDAPEKPLKPKVIKTVAKAEPVVAKAKTVTKTAAVVEQARQPLRTVAGPTTRRTTRATAVAAAPEPKPMQKVKQQPRIEVHQDEPMVIDVPTSTARSVNPHKVTESTKASVARHAGIYRRSREAVVAEQQQRIVEDAEDDRVFKKRRTSSDAPVDADAEEEKPPSNEDKIALETYAEEEPEADPFGHEWDDLDAGDDDDPLMVSEYVSDIVKYLKELEVSPRQVEGAFPLMAPPGHDHAQPGLHAVPKRARMEHERHPDGLARHDPCAIPSSS
jgi:G2/mitotic-specific cyclin 2